MRRLMLAVAAALIVAGAALLPSHLATAISAGGTYSLQPAIATGDPASAPQAIVSDPMGNIWFQNFVGGTIQAISHGSATASSPIVVTSELNSLAIDPEGNLWFPQDDGSAVVKWITGTNPAQTTSIEVGVGPYPGPYGIAVDRLGNVWIANFFQSTVQEIPVGSATANEPIVVGSYPCVIAVDPSGNVWVTNGGDATISKIPFGATTADPPIAVGNNPFGIVSDSTGTIWVANSGDDTISRIPAGASEVDATISVAAGPNMLAIDPFDNLWMTEYANSIQRISFGSNVADSPIALSTGSQTSSIVSDPFGNIWFTNRGHGTVQELLYTPPTPTTTTTNVRPDPVAPAFTG